ncbi:MAG: replicative DNA helicase [Ferrovum sp. 37-45-19]|uniref:replicative DNA helicase n=1 Tax=Ferrovum sp. JA12 TaxID=1356299 RepID=UPI000702D2AC|nr:replicative DNA helicase [Ferrovum sp. JA12]OYV78888.1 MAG: replicative DNA helicase [Ferrovum sp. 21-44-67]OYV93389.1 MAG: replicative DNA helicase [Ferrovum sp. 37-45-19]OZB33413.1 MAG: replicative DNA helicase [Ferrovum sp. 34-44-207]HQT82162.1 replicative DNA helicase [Ferrovaceae bacterium]KRH78817.1 replicative DNA helicase [Ferrovum sp. JA12]
MADDSRSANLRVPPHNIEAEQSVLGGLLLDNHAWDKIADLINESDYYREDHRKIYRAILSLVEKGKPADILTLCDELSLRGELESIGGLSYIASITQSVPSSANIRRYAEIVRERSIMRSLVQVGSDITESAFNPSGRDARALLDEAEAKVFNIAESGAKHSQGFVALKVPLAQVVEQVDELYHAGNHDPVTGIPTGFVDLDEKTSGFQKGDLIIVAGRPSMGKTALALNIAGHVGIQSKLPVAVFSMEMSSNQLAMRILSFHGRLDAHQLRTGRLKEEDFRRVSRALEELHEVPIHIDETPALNPLDLRARSRRLHRQYGGLGLIVVDYLQLMTSSSSGENRATEISEISRSLKALAKELNVPVVALSQLNRGLEQRPNKRPVMSDLRESGAIEQDADVILFIYRDEVYNPDSPDKGMAEIIIGKQRNGPIGMVPLTFLGHYTRFENYASAINYQANDY